MMRPDTTDEPVAVTPSIAVASMTMRAMSTAASVTLVLPDHDRSRSDDLLGWATGRIAELEARWSRFVDTSDVARLNRADGDVVGVTADTVHAVRAACAAWAFTKGAFDPTVHDSLLRLGYDAPIDEVMRRDPHERSASATEPIPAPGCGGILIDDERNEVRLPRGVRLDLGGIGKGLAADLVATGLVARGAAGVLVDIGGDVRVTGTAPREDGWWVDVEDAATDQPIGRLVVRDGGIATSTTLRRRWMAADRTPRHHLVAPRSGRPTDSPVVSVTVLAGTAAWADALSKVPFVDPEAITEIAPAAALVVRADQSIECVGDFPIELAARPETRHR